MARKMTAEAKALNAKVKAEREAAMAASAAAASLDACEGAVQPSAEREASFHLASLKMDAERTRERYVEALRDFAERAANEAKQAADGNHPFYTGQWFAGRAAEIEKLLAEYKAALTTQALIEKLMPGVKPAF